MVELIEGGLLLSKSFLDVCQIVGQFDGDGLIVKKAEQDIAHAGLAASLIEI